MRKFTSDKIVFGEYIVISPEMVREETSSMMFKTSARLLEFFRKLAITESTYLLLVCERGERPPTKLMFSCDVIVRLIDDKHLKVLKDRTGLFHPTMSEKCKYLT